MSTSFTAPKGTFDTLPPESATFLAVREALLAPLRRAGYGYIETPTFEDTALFARGVGESTDVVSKEMYTFTDKGGRSLTLRPELTAGLMRAFIEHKLYAGQLPAKLYTAGSNYRYERPQAGRYRHFTQVDLEAIGVDDPALDAEVVQLLDLSFRGLGPDPVHAAAHLAGRPELPAGLPAAAAGVPGRPGPGRGHPAPGRDQPAAGARRQACRGPGPARRRPAHGRPPVRGLPRPLRRGARLPQAARRAVGGGAPAGPRPRLLHPDDVRVRAQRARRRSPRSAAAAGTTACPRSSAGPTLPGIGWAIGRRPHAARDEGRGRDPGRRVPPRRVRRAAGRRPSRGRWRSSPSCARPASRADLAYGNRGLKGAMKAADRSGARYAVVLGERDLEGGTAQLKDLASGEQLTVALTDLASTLQEKLS